MFQEAMIFCHGRRSICEDRRRSTKINGGSTEITPGSTRNQKSSTERSNHVHREKNRLQKTKKRLERTREQKQIKKIRSSNPSSAVIPELDAALSNISAAVDRLQASDFRLQEEVQSSKSKVQSAEVGRPGSGRRDVTVDNPSTIRGGHGVTALPEVRSPKPEARAQLATPALGLVLATNNAIVVTWEPVANSQQVLAVYSKDPDFENHGVIGVSGTLNSATITGLQPNTLYYIRIKATGTGSYTDSEYSSVKTVTTQRDATSGAGDDPVSQLQNWLTDQQAMFQSVAALVPQLENTVLDTTERRRLLGSGVRRYGFIEKVIEVGGEFPQFWPAFAGEGEELRELVKKIDVYRNLLIWFQYCARVTGDLVLLAGTDAFRTAGTYYTSARDAARRGIPEAIQVFERLRLFWRRRRNTSTEPTVPEVERDLRALLRGTKDGEIVVRNESDSTVKGEKVIIDNTQRKPRGGVKVVERASAEIRDQNAE